MPECNFLISCQESVDGKVDWEEFQRLKKAKLVFIRRHPSLPFSILMYTPKAKALSKWTKEVIISRGLVVDDSGNIIARPLPKFFNDFEITGNLPSGSIEVFEKMDGSLIVMFFFRGEPHFCTKGNFSSPQAAKADEIFKSKYRGAMIDEEYTYCFEVIYPDNKIVVDYESVEDIFLIAKIHTKTGKEESIQDLGFKTVRQFAAIKGVDEMQGLKDMDTKNEEGFVLKFENNLRVKLKFESYFKLHRQMQVYSDHQIWTFLQKGEEIPCKHLSEEESERVATVKNNFHRKFESMKKQFAKEYEDIKHNSKNERDIITQIKSCSHPSLLFCFMRGKSCDPLVWRNLEPVK